MAVRMMYPAHVLAAAVACCGLVAVSASAQAAPADPVADGDARMIFALAPGNHPEGIAVGKRGVVYLGNRRDDGAGFVSEILAIARDGSASTFAVLARLDGDNPGDDGVLGLATDRRGDIYAAVVAPGAAAHGVWRIARDGSRHTLLPGSERMAFPNALVFDRRGNLYVTDSFGGAIWRFATGRGRPAYRAGEPWVRHELLAPAPHDPFGFPLPGANGIAFAPPNRLYAANTEKGLIARVPIDLADGSAGEPAILAAGPDLATVDGLTADAHGRVHAAIPGHAVLGTSPLVRVDPRTGVVAGLDPGEWEQFDVPLSLTGDTRGQEPRLLVTNGDLPGIPPVERRPGVVGVDVSHTMAGG